MSKAYYVELTVSAVIIADSDAHAMQIAELEAHEISTDGELCASHAIEIESLAELRSIDQSWDGACIPYGGDGNTKLKDLLPEDTPFKDTLTKDMFAGA